MLEGGWVDPPTDWPGKSPCPAGQKTLRLLGKQQDSSRDGRVNLALRKSALNSALPSSSALDWFFANLAQDTVNNHNGEWLTPIS
jgi:hypothetical protein